MAYKKPTLTEIYVRFLLAGGSLPQAKIFDVVPQLKTLGLTAIEMSQAVDLVPGAVSASVVPRVRCWDPDRLRLVQLSPDVFIVNQTKEYLGWSKFMGLVGDVRKEIQKTGTKVRANSIELHTIDKFTVPRDGYALGKWLNCDGQMIPRWYKDTKEACDIILGLGSPQTEKRNRQLQVSVKPVEANVTISFEFTFLETLEETSDVDKILESLHKESNDMYESVITDSVRLEIMGGKLAK